MTAQPSAFRHLPQKALTALVYVFLFLPVLMVAAMSFNSSRYSVFPVPGWTAKWYRAAAADELIVESLKISAVLSLCAAVIATVIGSAAAVALVRYRFRFRDAIRAAFVSPLIIPEMILAVTLLMLSASLDLRGGFWTVVAGHVLICLPFVITVMSARLHGFDRSLEEAAMDLGAGEWRTFWHVTFPLSLPGVVGGALLAFTVSFDNFIITFMVAGSDIVTVPVKIYSMIRTEFSPKLHALSTFVVFVTLGILVLYRLVLRGAARW